MGYVSMTDAGNRTPHRFCAPVKRGSLGGGPTVSKAPPFGAEAEPESHPLSVSLVSFCTSRKKLALGAKTQIQRACRHPPAKRQRNPDGISPISYLITPI